MIDQNRNRQDMAQPSTRRRRSVPVHRPGQVPSPDGPTSGKKPRRRGQTAVVVALCMFVVIAMIGLAIDGGASYELRRRAQNASDGSALAGARVMLDRYEVMIFDNPDYDVDGTPEEEEQILQAIHRYASLNGVVTSTLETYFVDDNKQVVSVLVNPFGRHGPCGSAMGTPCEIGDNEAVPWTNGAKGIAVKSRAESDAFFMKVMGWDTVGAAASATAFMGVGVAQDDISVVPIALFTDTATINFVIGQRYTLLEADITQGSGNWGWVDFNGSGISATTVRSWLECGFNPIVTSGTWPSWCPRYTNADGYGPTRHYRPIENPDPPDNYDPDPNPFYIPSLVYGPGRYGWWLRGSSGGVNANCQDFRGRIDAGSPDEGTLILFPIFDRQVPAGGTDTFYHVRVIVAFTLYPGDVQCRPYTPPTATPCSLCPTATPSAGGGSRERWFIQGVARQVYSRGTAGRHGDLRHTADHLVFLDN